MRLMAALISYLLLGGQTYPPPYPREGTKALIDNARAQVWDVSWPKGRPSALHRHLYVLDNERVTVWEYTSGSDPGRGSGRGLTPGTRHSHPMDTFLVWTEGRVGHAVFVPAGTVHTDEPIGPATKATIFELR
jgi:hypothetical protein